jgi:hypothetical protein
MFRHRRLQLVRRDERQAQLPGQGMGVGLLDAQTRIARTIGMEPGDHLEEIGRTVTPEQLQAECDELCCFIARDHPRIRHMLSFRWSPDEATRSSS